MTDPRGAAGDSGSRRCMRCGRSASEDEQAQVPLLWTLLRDDPNGVVVVCPECTRAHVRDIEGRLDEQWW